MNIPTRILLAGGLAILMMLGALPATAQKFYKSTMPDGKVVYGDKPAPGAVKVEETSVDTSKRGVGPGTSAKDPAAREAETLKQLEQARHKREAAQDKVSAAEKALRDAETARDTGKEPLEGERIGTVGGSAGKGKGKGKGAPTLNSRLTDAYWERQKKLEQDVEVARRNLEQVRSGK